MAALGPAAIAMQAVGGLVQGEQANKAARASARVDDENARLSILSGEQDALQTAHDERMQAGAQLAAMAGDGVQIGSGSAADLLAESAYQGSLEQFNIRTRAVRQSRNLSQQAADKRTAGRNALIGSMFGVAAGALQGVSNLRAQRAMDTGIANSRMPVPRPQIMGGTG